MRSARSSLQAAATACAILVLAVAHAAAAGPSMRSPDGGAVRGLLIGIDQYRHVRPLKGAVADARDIESAMRRMGARDLTVLIDDKADRDSVLREIGALVQRTNAGDTVVLSIAGHGAQEPERVKGSEPDGMENVFLLAGFDTTATGSQQRILGKEFHHFIKQFELRGASVLYIADACHGGGLARDIDPRADEMSFRQVPSYRVPVDLLQPVSSRSEAFTTELDFDRTTFLAAVDRKTKAPEVRVPGVEGLRGALSYAMARAIEGNADHDGNGKVTLKELFSSVRQVVYQLSEQRQNVVTLAPPSRDIERDVAFQITRGVQLLDAPQSVSQNPAAPPPPTKQVVSAGRPADGTARQQRPVRLAALDGRPVHFSQLAPREAPFEIVGPVDYPDLIWDPKSRDVLAWGDIIAHKIDQSDLPSVIDRAAAVRELKQIATKSPQPIKIAPDDRRHRSDTVVQVQVSEIAGRALVLFNIAGDGTVQLLYPLDADPPIVPTSEFGLRMRVREPFGADQIVAVSAAQRMNPLVDALTQLNRRRAAAQAVAMLLKYAPADARVGATNLFTAP